MRCLVQPSSTLGREQGFTLLEVLVASVIAALALGVLLQGALASVRSVRVSGQYQEALSRARSHLAALDDGSLLKPGEHAGNDGRGFRWQLRISPAGTAPLGRGDTNEAGGARVALYAVTVVVSWDGEAGPRQVRLDSKRVAAALSAPP
jgi:general secretion pathway protein I